MLIPAPYVYKMKRLLLCDLAIPYMKQYSVVISASICALAVAATGCAPRQKIVPPVAGGMKAVGSAQETAGPDGSPYQARRHQKAGVVVERAVLCAAVDDRVPQGISSTFAPSVGKVFYYTVVCGAERPMTLFHLWSRDGKETARVPVQVQSARWRTFSSKTIDPSCAGAWTVKVVDAGGKEFASNDFSVTSVQDGER
jgi:hypothetical protein